MYRNDPDSTNRVTIALIVAFVLATVIFITDKNSNRAFQKSKSMTDQTAAPVLSALSTPIRATEDFFSRFKDRRRALEENIVLKQELYQLREAKDRANIMAMKLARFEQILKADIGTDIPTKKISARAVSEIDGPFVRAALINAGTHKGIKIGHPVMTVDGLYGHVVRAGINSSRVLRLGDLNSRIAIMSSNSQATAILAGNNSDFPEISFMSDASAWAVGDVVITSGDDGVLPRGLPIGTVIRRAKNTLGVELNVERKPIDWVWVYPFDPIAVPEESLNETELILDGVNEAETVQTENNSLVQPAGNP